MLRGFEKNNFLHRSHWLKLILELTAVFIGITAGFFFENFREERANRIQEGKFLSSLVENVEADSTLINSYISSFKTGRDISRRAIMSMDSGRIEKDSAIALMGLLGSYNDLLLEDATYESIINSGKLDLIKEYSIREDILKYYQSLKSIKYVDEVYNNYLDNFVFPYIFKNMDFLTGEASEEFDPDSREFRNISVAYYVMVDAKVDLAETMDSLNLVLKNSLHAYLQ